MMSVLCCVLLYDFVHCLLLRCNNNILQSIDFKVVATAKSCREVKVSHAAVKSFDRPVIVRTLKQFSFRRRLMSLFGSSWLVTRM